MVDMKSDLIFHKIATSQLHFGHVLGLKSSAACQQIMYIFSNVQTILTLWYRLHNNVISIKT